MLAAPMAIGAIPKALLSTTRTRLPPTLVRTIYRSVWLLTVTGGRRCARRPRARGPVQVRQRRSWVWAWRCDRLEAPAPRPAATAVRRTQTTPRRPSAAPTGRRWQLDRTTASGLLSPWLLVPDVSLRPSRLLPVSLAVLVVAVLGASLVGGTPEREEFARRGRCGPQRLDSVDAILHTHELDEPDSADSGQVLDTAQRVRTPHRAPAAAYLTADDDICAPGPVGRLAGALQVRPHSVALPPHAPGRAPPLA